VIRSGAIVYTGDSSSDEMSRILICITPGFAVTSLELATKSDCSVIIPLFTVVSSNSLSLMRSCSVIISPFAIVVSGGSVVSVLFSITATLGAIVVASAAEDSV